MEPCSPEGLTIDPMAKGDLRALSVKNLERVENTCKTLLIWRWIAVYSHTCSTRRKWRN
jgi:hypothetical protein